MAQFEMKMQCNNAAFADAGVHAETARILREMADKIEAGADNGILRDVNGNNVGSFELFEEN